MTAFVLHRQSLRRTQRRRKTLIRVLAVLTLPLILMAEASADPDSIWRQSIEMLGLLFIVLGLLGRAWCSLYIGGRKSRQLVTVGPYSMSRNPLYLFSLVATAGLGAQTGSIVIALLAFLGAWLVFWPVIRHEEEILAKLFPTDYPDYRAHVPRLVPDIRRWADVGHLYVNPRLYRRTVLDSLVWLVLVPPVRLVGLLHESGILPVWIVLP